MEGIAEEDLLELIAEVGKCSPREIVRKINGLIVKWRISKSESHEGETYDLLAGLINETISDRMTKNKNEYEQFLHRLQWPTGGEGSTSYGQCLAEALEKKQESAYHGEIIGRLKEETDSENSPTMRSLIETLRKDEHLCNVLNSRPGRNWLRDKKYREEMREMYEEKISIEKSQEITSEGRNQPFPLREADQELTMDSDRILGMFRRVAIAAGKFDMGSEDGRENEKPVHTVKLDGFEMSATPVTQVQYQAIMGVNPSIHHKEGDKHGDELPVENVSWNDAMVFCEQLTKQLQGRCTVTLPTEAQWEYACRANTKTPFYTGDNLTTDQANYDGNYPYKKHPKGQYVGKSTPVGNYSPNAWGLYDMHGNVWEWCLDWYDEHYYDVCNKRGIVENSAGPETGSYRVFRGGSWSSYARNCRSAYRAGNAPGGRSNSIGFRLVFVP